MTKLFQEKGRDPKNQSDPLSFSVYWRLFFKVVPPTLQLTGKIWKSHSFDAAANSLNKQCEKICLESGNKIKCSTCRKPLERLPAIATVTTYNVCLIRNSLESLFSIHAYLCWSGKGWAGISMEFSAFEFQQ